MFVIIWQSNGFILQMKPTFQYFVWKKDNI